MGDLGHPRLKFDEVCCVLGQEQNNASGEKSHELGVLFYTTELYIYVVYVGNEEFYSAHKESVVYFTLTSLPSVQILRIKEI